tara:strand:+ start:7279 stop:7614 length:336 start_codon:yes stop_codon:yes gene_type:complete
MKKILKENDGVVSTTFYDNTDSKGVTIKRSLNAQSLLDRNKKLYTHNDGYSKTKELKRVASIPVLILELWSQEYNGTSNWFALPKQVQQKILRTKLNSSEYQYFRTAPGKI